MVLRPEIQRPRPERCLLRPKRICRRPDFIPGLVRLADRLPVSLRCRRSVAREVARQPLIEWNGSHPLKSRNTDPTQGPHDPHGCQPGSYAATPGFAVLQPTTWGLTSAIPLPSLRSAGEIARTRDPRSGCRARCRPKESTPDKPTGDGRDGCRRTRADVCHHREAASDACGSDLSTQSHRRIGSAELLAVRRLSFPPPGPAGSWKTFRTGRSSRDGVCLGPAYRRCSQSASGASRGVWPRQSSESSRGGRRG